LEEDFCQSSWVRLCNYGLNDKCVTKHEVRLTGRIQPRLIVWHSNYNIRWGGKTHYNMVQCGILSMSGLCHSAFKKTLRIFLVDGNWQQMATVLMGTCQYNLSSIFFLVFPPKYWYCGPYDILHWMYVPSVPSKVCSQNSVIHTTSTDRGGNWGRKFLLGWHQI
jgi:hypothetical protein